jgi:hypothetical protein
VNSFARRVVILASGGLLAAVLGATSSGAAFAVSPPGTGQPNQECGSAEAPNTPGNAAAAPGSPFNEEGHAGTVYAGEQPQNSKNPKSVSQYDVACFQVSQH